jgi:hypothetical protein
MNEYINSNSCITPYVKEIINYSYAKGVYFLAGDGIFLLSTTSIRVVGIATDYGLDNRGVGVGSPGKPKNLLFSTSTRPVLGST